RPPDDPPLHSGRDRPVRRHPPPAFPLVPRTAPLRSRLLRQRRGVPDLHGAVPAPANEAAAVRVERHAVGKPADPVKGGEFLAGLDIPHFHLTPLTSTTYASARDQPFAVRAEGHAEHNAGVSLEGKEFLAGLDIPHLDSKCLWPCGWSAWGWSEVGLATCQ